MTTIEYLTFQSNVNANGGKSWIKAA